MCTMGIAHLLHDIGRYRLLCIVKKQKMVLINNHVLVLTYMWNSIVWNEILLIMAISSKFIWSFLLNLFLSEDVVQALDHSSVVVPLATHKRRCYVHTACYYQHIEVSYIDGLNTCTWWAQRKPRYIHRCRSITEEVKNMIYWNQNNEKGKKSIYC